MPWIWRNEPHNQPQRPKQVPTDGGSHAGSVPAIPSGFAQFAAFDQDAADNRAWLATGARLQMPVLALGGKKSFGAAMAAVMRAAAVDVREGIIPGSGHWIMEENPQATISVVRDFLV